MTELAQRRPMPAWVGEAAAAAALVVSTWAPLRNGLPDHAAPVLVRLLLLTLLAGTVPLSRRHPLLALLLSMPFAVSAPAWAGSSPVYLLAVVFSLYRVALARDRRRVVVIAVCCGGLLLLVALLTDGSGLRYYRIVQPAAVVVAAAAAGDATRTRRTYIAAISERAERAERTRDLEAARRVTEERFRIARELHDAAGHQIAAINLHAGVASNALPGDPGAAESELKLIRETAAGAMTEIRALLRILRTSGASSGDEPVEPVATLARLPALFTHFERAGLRLDVELPEDLPDLVDDAVDIAAYRTVQEGLANALKHGTAGEARVRIARRRSEIEIEIENAARADAIGRVTSTDRLGLLGLRERATAVGGHLDITLDQGAFRLVVSLPTTSVRARRTASRA